MCTLLSNTLSNLIMIEKTGLSNKAYIRTVNYNYRLKKHIFATKTAIIFR